MRILFISHSYPPIWGGVESQNYHLAKGLSKIAKVKIIANGYGKKFLPIFLPTAFLKAFFLMTQYDVCLLGNGVIAPIGAILKFFHPRKKFFCVVHGLDITFANQTSPLAKIYRAINLPALKKLNKLIMVGNATIEEAVKIGIERENCVFIPNGVNPEEIKKNHTRKELAKIFGKNLENKKLLFRLARFVPHKGTSWFIENVMPKLPENVVMIAAGGRVGKKTAGDVDDYLECERAIIDNHLQDRVKLLACISEKDKLVILNTADIVVSPNIKVAGSMEGFGINVLEAGACGRVVVASELEGLADAVKNGKNGFLVTSEDVPQWIKKIQALLNVGDTFMQMFGQRTEKYVKENFSWQIICQKYLAELSK